MRCLSSSEGIAVLRNIARVLTRRASPASLSTPRLLTSTPTTMNSLLTPPTPLLLLCLLRRRSLLPCLLELVVMVEVSPVSQRQHLCLPSYRRRHLPLPLLHLQQMMLIVMLPPCISCQAAFAPRNSPLSLIISRVQIHAQLRLHLHPSKFPLLLLRRSSLVDRASITTTTTRPPQPHRLSHPRPHPPWPAKMA